MDAPSHAGAEVAFQQLQIFGGEVRRGHETNPQHVQRFLFELALDNIANALQDRVHTSEKAALAGEDKIV